MRNQRKKMKNYFIITFIFLFLSCSNEKDSYKKIELEPVKTIGGTEVEEGNEIGYLSDFVVTKKNLIVADLYANEIILFGKDGFCRSRIGNRGSGPAEFERIRKIYYCNNEIIADDWGNRRFQFFAENGDFRKIFNYSQLIIGSGIKIQEDAFDDKGNYFIATNAFKSNYLIRKYDGNFNKILEFGDLESKEMPVVNPDYFKKYIIKKRNFTG